MPTIESTSSVDVGKIDEDETSLNNKDKMIERRLGNYFLATKASRQEEKDVELDLKVDVIMNRFGKRGQQSIQNFLHGATRSCIRSFSLVKVERKKCSR